jgi:hypothetical protein
LSHLPATTEYISCQLHPINGATLKNDFKIKLKSPNNTVLGIMKTKSLKEHAVQVHPVRAGDRYVVISMDTVYSVIFGDHKPQLEHHAEDSVAVANPEKAGKKRASSVGAAPLAVSLVTHTKSPAAI